MGIHTTLGATRRAFSGAVLRVMNELTLVHFFHSVIFCLSNYVIVSILYLPAEKPKIRYENFIRCVTDMLTTRRREHEFVVCHLLRNSPAVPLHVDGNRCHSLFLFSIIL